MKDNTNNEERSSALTYTLYQKIKDAGFHISRVIPKKAADNKDSDVVSDPAPVEG